jgi:hypothetical protein
MQRMGHRAIAAGGAAQMLKPYPDSILFGWIPALTSPQLLGGERLGGRSLPLRNGAAFFQAPHGRCCFIDRGADLEHAVAAQDQRVRIA